jgi:hypothetical protein
MFIKCTDRKYGTYDVFFYDPDNALWVWKNGADYCLSALVGVPVSVDSGASKYPSGFVYNGQDYYDIGGGLWLWYDSIASKYVISSYLGYGIQEYSTGTSPVVWHGDDWWSCDTLAGTYVRRGAAKEAGHSDKVVTLPAIIGRESAGLIGEYEPITGSGLTGNRYVGWRILEDAVLDPAIEFIESLELLNGEPVYNGADGRFLWYDGADYIISPVAGTADELVGYWSCGTLLGTYSLTYEGEGSDPAPETYTISFKEFREKSNAVAYDSQDSYIAQVALMVAEA